MTDEPFTASTMPDPGEQVLLRLHMLDGTTLSHGYLVPDTGWSGRITLHDNVFQQIGATGIRHPIYDFQQIQP